MKTTVKLSAGSIEVSISGITVVINPENLSEGIHTLKSFYDSIIPAERKDSMVGSGVEEAFKLFNQYEPFIKRFLASYHVQGNAESTITINEDGSIDMWSSEQAITFDAKYFMQTLSDFATFKDAESKAKKESEQSDKLPHHYFQYGSLTQAMTAANLAEALDLDVDQIIGAVKEYEDEPISPNEVFSSTKVHMFSEAFRWVCVIQSDGLVLIRDCGTDQSMEYMDDNELEFNSRPTNHQLYEAIKAKTGITDLKWVDIWETMNQLQGIQLDKDSLATTSTCIHACDAYGLKAINNFNNPEWKELRDAINRF